MAASRAAAWLRSGSRRRGSSANAAPAAALPGEAEPPLLLRLGAGKHRPLRDPDAAALRTRRDLGHARLRIAFALALLAHRRRWLRPPLLAGTGILYAIPSIAFFLLLLPITGRGRDTAIIALTAYTLQIIYRNTVPASTTFPTRSNDAARGMGMTERQILWKVELPMALPEIIAGLRIATVSTVAIATLAVFAGGGGLGTQILGEADLSFPTAIVIAVGIVIAMALAFDAILLTIQPTRPLATGEGVMICSPMPLVASFGGAIEFIFSPQTSNVTGGKKVGGIDQVIELALTQLELTSWRGPGASDRPSRWPLLRPPGRRRTVAVGLGNAGRPSPSWRLIALIAAVIGVGLFTLTSPWRSSASRRS